MNFREEIEKERKEYLGLNKIDTKKVFQTIIDYYKKKIIESPREVIGYSIDITICNMHLYNKLGKLEDLNKNWGDSNFYVDLKNSAYVDKQANDDGNLEIMESIEFKDILELKEIENLAFSLKEFIDLCKEYDFEIKIYAKDEDTFETTLEISPYLPFSLNDNIKCYLDSLK